MFANNSFYRANIKLHHKIVPQIREIVSQLFSSFFIDGHSFLEIFSHMQIIVTWRRSHCKHFNASDEIFKDFDCLSTYSKYRTANPLLVYTKANITSACCS